MSEKTIQRIGFVFSIVTSLLLVITGVLLMIACKSIYDMGNRPFTVENISAKFSKIDVVVYITLAAVVINGVLSLISAKKKAPQKTVVHKDKLLSKLEARLDVNSCDQNTLAAIKKEKKLRIAAFCTAAFICIAAISVVLVYALDFSHFNDDYNQSVIALTAFTLPIFFIAAGTGFAMCLVSSASIDRQTALVKSAIANGAKADTLPADSKKGCKKGARTILGVRLGVVAVALVFIVLGIVNGGMADVLSKAINICTECIGLG